MNRVLLASLPYQAAWLVPSTLLGAVYAAGGRSPLWGLIAGGVGLLGAALAQAVRRGVDRWARARFDEAIAAAWLERVRARNHPDHAEDDRP